MLSKFGNRTAFAEMKDYLYEYLQILFDDFMKKMIIISLFAFLLLPMPALSWDGYTHKILWQTAIKDINLSGCDKSIVNKILNTAPVLPDRNGNKKNHVCYQTHCPAMDKVNELLTKAKAEKNFCEKMFILGQASHYYADSKSPPHQKLVSNNCHTNFERDAGKYIKNNFTSSVNRKCRNPQDVLTFNRTDFENLVKGIRTEIIEKVI